MSLPLDEVRSACTAAEYAILLASRSPSIEKLSLAELKKHSANARKLSDKWQKLSRGQSRTQSKATGSPNLDSRSYTKQQAFHEALGAFEAHLAKMSSVATVQPASTKQPEKICIWKRKPSTRKRAQRQPPLLPQSPL